jgi:hypothetical protein
VTGTDSRTDPWYAGGKAHGGKIPLRCPLLIFVLLAIGAPLHVFAQDADNARGRVITAVRLPADSAIRLDGALDEAIWAAVAPATGFVQRDPDNGAPATEPTEVRLLYDASRLIVGARLHDSEPDAVLGNQMQRDQSFSSDDRFIVTLDTFLDGRTGYIFQTNPLGALSDGLVSASSNSNDAAHRDFGAAVNQSWDGIWTVRVQRDESGWTVEMELPFRTLNFDPRLDGWGVNFQRTIRRKAEESVWSGFQRNEGVAHMSSAGRLQGLAGLSQGLGLDVTPYVVGNLTSAPGRGRGDHVATGDVGVDLFYNLTTGLRANLSVNTDFAETEVDDRQINLTRFPQFFEEKRDFFLQGGNYFDFAREIGDQVTPFFSRRIGLDDRGVPQPIDVGAKLTGQAGAFDVGFLQVRTRDTASQVGADFTAARLRRRFLRESYAGVLYTRRADHRPGASDLHTLGLDSALRTSSLFGNKTLEWSSWFIHTTNPQESLPVAGGSAGTASPSDARTAEGRNIGRGSRVAFPNDPFYFDFSYRELQRHYGPAVGFIQRRGFRRFNPEVGYTFRFRDHPWLRWIQHEIDWDWYQDDGDHRLLTETKQFKPLTVGFSDGSEFAYEVHPTYERLERDFEIFEGITLPVGGEYRYTRHEVRASMADRYPVAVGGQVNFGRFFSGRNREHMVNVAVRPRAGVALRFELEYNTLELAEGDFDTTLMRLLANTQFSPWTSLENNLQYDSVSRSMGWQTRFRWIQRPGNDLFVVYTHNWQERADAAGRTFRTLDNKAATKLVYTLRF